MKVVIFGLTLSSSWGNGHATLWRGILRALAERGHRIAFFEKDVPYYAENRDLTELPGTRLFLYSSWEGIVAAATRELRDADAAIVTSYCPDGVEASRLVLSSPAKKRVFYDMDTPVTLERLARGETVEYLPPEGLGDFDLVLSYTGGLALSELKSRLGAKIVAPLYGSVDPRVHQRKPATETLRSDLCYLGTYAADRQAALEEFFVEPARRMPHRRFLLVGAQYPKTFPWQKNLFYIPHLAPSEHGALYASSRLTLNVTRGAMARMGYCPSGRLFEAAACGAPILSDGWEGLDQFFEPGSEILIARSPEDALNAMELTDAELSRIARAAQERTLQDHTAAKRALELEDLLGGPFARQKNSWGLIPAAGAGSRIQPLAFSKELLPVGSRIEESTERPRAVSEFLLERMILGGASKISFIISPGKWDILGYFGGKYDLAEIFYGVQPKPAGLCDALFRSIPLIHADDDVLVGLPDTVWFPENGFQLIAGDTLKFLLFPVEHPEFFDAVMMDEDSRVLEIQVKNAQPASHWVWGAFRMPGKIFHELHALWIERERRDEYMGTLVNAWIGRGGRAEGIRAGDIYVDVGTLHGYREAIQALTSRCSDRTLPSRSVPAFRDPE